MVKYATGLAIFISCLGLLGLATFSAEQRTKEIGIRKVLGASATNIVMLLSGNFLKLVLLAVVVGSPLGWWATHKWLQDFAYRTSVSWGIFAFAASAILLLAFLTISIQAFRAAMANPARSLKVE
jgi:putative ABC transport system permease protein